MVNKLCDSCLPRQYLESYYCLSCSDECLTCSDFSYCITCSDPSKTAILGTCGSQCSSGFYDFNETCLPCQPLCLECYHLANCSNCVSNSVYKEDKCECSVGYKNSSNDCVEVFFDASLSISTKNIAKLSFTEQSSLALELKDFIFEVENRTDLKVTLYKNSLNKELLFLLNFKDSVKTGTPIKLNITIAELRSTNGSQLRDSILHSELKEYNKIIIEPSIDIAITITQSSTKTIVSTSILSSMISNPAAA